METIYKNDRVILFRVYDLSFFFPKPNIRERYFYFVDFSGVRSSNSNKLVCDVIATDIKSKNTKIPGKTSYFTSEMKIELFNFDCDMTRSPWWIYIQGVWFLFLQLFTETLRNTIEEKLDSVLYVLLSWSNFAIITIKSINSREKCQNLNNEFINKFSCYLIT